MTKAANIIGFSQQAVGSNFMYSNIDYSSKSKFGFDNKYAGYDKYQDDNKICIINFTLERHFDDLKCTLRLWQVNMNIIESLNSI